MRQCSKKSVASNGQSEWIGVNKKCVRIQKDGVKQHETRIINKEIVPQNEVAVQQRDENPPNTTTKAVVVPLSTTKSSAKRKMEKRVESKAKEPQRQITKKKTKKWYFDPKRVSFSESANNQWLREYDENAAEREAERAEQELMEQNKSWTETPKEIQQKRSISRFQAKRLNIKKRVIRKHATRFFAARKIPSFLRWFIAAFLISATSYCANATPTTSPTGSPTTGSPTTSSPTTSTPPTTQSGTAHGRAPGPRAGRLPAGG